MISKKQADTEAYSDNIFFYSAARIGFSRLLKHLNFEKGETILLPSYIGLSVNEGSGVFDPITENQIDFEFYALNEDLSVNLEDFESKVSKGHTKAAFIIYYFGFLLSDIEKIAVICKKNRVFLIEDCAHSLTSRYRDKYLGEFGDFSLFSIHKVLPTSNGGLVKINNPSFKFPPVRDKDRISKESLEILYKSRLESISLVRRNNYISLAQELEGIEDIRILYPALPEQIVPLNFPILILNKNREKIYYALRNEGVTAVALYYQLIDQIDEKHYPISHRISRSILNLPIHQDIRPDQIGYIAKKLIKVLRSN
jgi:dTDP-4-amino-4,6-dideoxygalactose transaminase